MSTPKDAIYKQYKKLFKEWNGAKHKSINELENFNRMMIERLKKIDEEVDKEE